MNKLKVGDIIQVDGFVMLAKLPPGRYRVQFINTRNGIEAYSFAKPRGFKTLVRHATSNVDPWIRNADDPDLNRITLSK